MKVYLVQWYFCEESGVDGVFLDSSEAHRYADFMNLHDNSHHEVEETETLDGFSDMKWLRWHGFEISPDGAIPCESEHYCLNSYDDSVKAKTKIPQEKGAKRQPRKTQDFSEQVEFIETG